jgi:hypothetical protein
MRKKLKHTLSTRSLFGAIGALLMLSTTSQAEIIHAPESFGAGSHSTTRWQQLGDSENGQITDPFGISWSLDGGDNWGRDELSVGDAVIFKMDMFKRITGTHYADHAKLWLDLDKNGSFSENESLMYGEQQLLNTESGNLGQTTPNQQSFQFYSDVLHIGHEHLGDMWLRGRVVCSESLVNMTGGSWNDQFSSPYTERYNQIFSPTQHYYQGEKEDHLVTVGFGDGSVVTPKPVSTPAIGLMSLAIFACSAGLWTRRQKKRKNT